MEPDFFPKSFWVISFAPLVMKFAHNVKASRYFQKSCQKLENDTSFYLDLEQLNSEEIMETLHASAEWFICFCQAEDNETDEEDNE